MKKLILLAFCMCGSLVVSGQTVYPTPQHMEVLDGQATYNQKNVKVKLLKSIAEEQPDGYYTLEVTAKKIFITAGTPRGLFYAQQTLRQLTTDGKLPLVSITDYPDIPFRGSVEGFYGKPWSHRDRLSQLKFYGENKLNTYIYGPKDDPYHSSPNWRKPYPEKEAQQISELAQTAKDNYVDFVWAIHPGLDIQWTEEDFQNLLGKFNDMYDLGVRSFALFFDDISGEGTKPHKQAELLNRLNREFVQAKGDVTPLIMCPTEYNKSWANPTDEGYLAILGRELDKSIQIMWTGDMVCADITTETLEWINARIQRPTYIWWNFPVTDYIRHLVLQGPTYGLTSEGKGKMNGFVSNPMENAEASKIALFGVADYTWNIAAYNYLQTWEVALQRLMPKASQAYRTFAIHSSDMEQNGHGYRRAESWEETPDMYAEFQKMSQAPAKMLNSGADQYLLEELKPWLVEFEKLGQRGMAAVELEKTYNSGDKATFWRNYLAGEMTPEQVKAYNAHKSGTLRMQPYITNTRARLALDFYEALAGEKIPVVTPITNFERRETLPHMMDNRVDTHYYSWDAQNVGKWIGVDLGRTENVTNIVVDQGRKDGDNDYFQRAILEYSVDSLAWTPITDTLRDVYNIRYNARPVQARYVRLRAVEGSSSKNWTAMRRFEVNPQQNEPVVMTNLPQVSKAGVDIQGNTTSIKPIFEVMKLAKGDYLGIELPIISDIASVVTELKGLEYSLDGTQWTTQKLTKARYVRYMAPKDMELKLDKFELTIVQTPAQGIIKAFDKDFMSGFTLSKGLFVLHVPPKVDGVTLLFDNGSLVLNDVSQGTLGASDNGLLSVNFGSNTQSLTVVGSAHIREIIWHKK